MAAEETAQLRTRLENLPQELYDEIYDLTFAAEPGIRYLDRFVPEGLKKDKIRPLFRGPDSVHLLHVDRASRAKFAKSYYGGSGAVFMATSHSDRHGRNRDGTRSCITWLLEVPESHREMIQDIRLAILGFARPPAADVERTRYFPGNDKALKAQIECEMALGFGESVSNVITYGYEDEVRTLDPFRKKAHVLTLRI